MAEKEAMLYEKIESHSVRCRLCAHRCAIKEGGRGICRVRENRGGVLFTLVYGLVISAAIDPIEKKPLYHFYPGSRSFSIATVGCNFKCRHCQNYSISQMVNDKGELAGDDFPPEKVVQEAERARCKSISYTYTEPTIYFEYAFDTCRSAHEVGIKNNFVTNGYQTPETIETVAPYLDAANVDLKAFSEEFYQKVCKARLAPVLETIRLLWEKGVWVEVTTLVIPRHNDSDEELRHIARFLKSVSPDLPWHLSAFYPTYRLTDASRTPSQTLEKAREVGLKEGLNYVYVGNIVSSAGEATYCKNCRKLLIARQGFTITESNMDGARCKFCGAEQAGRF